MDLQAVKTVATSDLVECAIGAAVNARGLLEDAELLSTSGRHARAYALAALAVEEAGKAASLTALAAMPESLRAQAPVGRMLEWHQLKLVGGLVITAIPLGTVAEQLEVMPPSQVAGIMQDAQVLAQDADELKQRGLYADIDPSGRVRLPSEITEADVATQLGRARLAVASASVLLKPGTAARLANPPPVAVEFCRAIVSAFAEAGSGRTPEAAAEVYLSMARKFQEQSAPEPVRTRPRRAGRDARLASGFPLLAGVFGFDDVTHEVAPPPVEHVAGAALEFRVARQAGSSPTPSTPYPARSPAL